MSIQALIRAIRSNDLVAIKALLTEDPSLINRVDINGDSPLMIADANNHDAIIEFLLANNASPYDENDEGRSVITCAIENGNFYRVWLYLTNQSNPMYRNRVNDINAQDAESNTLLQLAINAEDDCADNVVLHLLFAPQVITAHQISLELFDNIAGENFSRETLEEIIALRRRSLVARSDITQRNSDNHTAWDMAVRSGNLAYVGLLLAAGALITEDTYGLANNGMPYVLATLRIFDIADRNNGLEGGRENFARHFIDALFDPTTILEDKNNNHYAFIIGNIEADLVMPYDIANLIQHNERQQQQLSLLLAKENRYSHPDIMDFLRDIDELLLQQQPDFPAGIHFAFSCRQEAASQEQPEQERLFDHSNRGGIG